MQKTSKGMTIIAVLVVIGIILSACATATATPTQEQPVSMPTQQQPVSAPTEPPVPTAVPEKSQIVIVIAEDPPSFNPTINASGFDVLVMELVML
jgi:ABC-type transport system substrate-binding protein